MKTIAPLLFTYEEHLCSLPNHTFVRLEDEPTFVGTIYKSTLLDSTSAKTQNRVSKWTKVPNETTDDE
jgi:hypothetical protein